MIVKVCGITSDTNYQAITKMDVQMVGINFYDLSKRFINGVNLGRKNHEKRVGVFVNSSIEEILRWKHEYKLDYAQLHGDEDAQFCQRVSGILPVIKVFRVDNQFSWSEVNGFECAEYYLFDTKTKRYGGSGKQFNWAMLHDYPGSTPFLLSGGIGPDDVEAIQSVGHPLMEGIDINSKFEDSPGKKNIELIQKFIKELKITK